MRILRPLHDQHRYPASRLAPHAVVLFAGQRVVADCRRLHPEAAGERHLRLEAQRGGVREARVDEWDRRQSCDVCIRRADPRDEGQERGVSALPAELDREDRAPVVDDAGDEVRPIVMDDVYGYGT